MVILGGWVFLMSEVPLYGTLFLSRSRRFRANREQLQNGSRLEPETQGQTLVLTAMCAMFARCRGTSLTRSNADLGPYSRAMPGALWWN